MQKLYIAVNDHTCTFRVLTQHKASVQERVQASADASTAEGIGLLSQQFIALEQAGYKASVLFIVKNVSALTYRVTPTCILQPGETCHGKFNLNVTAHYRALHDEKLWLSSKGYMLTPPRPVSVVDAKPTYAELLDALKQVSDSGQLVNPGMSIHLRKLIERAS